MARKARSGSKGSRSRKTSGTRGRVRSFISLLQGILTTIILIGAGILIGSFWGEWNGGQFGGNPAPDPAASPLDERPKVEVLNGTGEAGLAQAVSERLVDLGFDVVMVANADNFDYGATVVLDRSGRAGTARRVASGIGADSIVVAVDLDLFLDATVVVGRDWSSMVSPARH